MRSLIILAGLVTIALSASLRKRHDEPGHSDEDEQFVAFLTNMIMKDKSCVDYFKLELAKAHDDGKTDAITVLSDILTTDDEEVLNGLYKHCPVFFYMDEGDGTEDNVAEKRSALRFF